MQRREYMLQRNAVEAPMVDKNDMFQLSTFICMTSNNSKLIWYLKSKKRTEAKQHFQKCCILMYETSMISQLYRVAQN